MNIGELEMKNNYHLFNTRLEEKEWVDENGLTDPYISYVKETSKLSYRYQEPVRVGQYLHKDGKINDTLGTDIVGICVIPEFMLPDGKARFMSMVNMSSSINTGTKKDEHLQWCPQYDQLNLENQYNRVPLDGELTGSITSQDGWGYLPTDRTDVPDRFTVDNSFDLGTKYYSNSNKIHSPYNVNGELSNPYIATKTSSGTTINTPLCHFDGAENTRVLVESSWETPAANACSNFAPGFKDGEWFLPSIGELGFIMPRFEYINSRIKDAAEVGAFAVALSLNHYYWSSSEYSTNGAWYLGTFDGDVYYDIKNDNYLVRAFLAP